MSLTDPQNDVPCRDCGRPTQHATEVCADCRTPAGRLLTKLAALGLTITTDKYADPFASIGEYGVRVVMEEVGDNLSNEPMYAAMIIPPECFRFTEDEISAAANAIAAIVDHAGTIATLAAKVKRLREELAHSSVLAWRGGSAGCSRESSNPARAVVGPNGWRVYITGRGDFGGPETSDAGRHAADLALLAAGYRLVGGVHPLPDEVPDAR